MEEPGRSSRDGWQAKYMSERVAVVDMALSGCSVDLGASLGRYNFACFAWVMEKRVFVFACGRRAWLFLPLKSIDLPRGGMVLVNRLLGHLLRSAEAPKKEGRRRHMRQPKQNPQLAICLC